MSDADDDDGAASKRSAHQAGDNSQIEVYGRVRPSPKNDRSALALSEDRRSVEFHLPRDAGAGGPGGSGGGGYINNKRETYDFRMAHIFDETATQADIFEGIGKKVVNNVLEGFNGCIFAYGQTGSGKTYSITGGADRYEDRGLIPRALSMIFAEKEARSAELVYSISISYLEIYNDDGYDLLDAEHETKSLTELPKVAMFEDDTGNIHMRNIHLLPANSVDEALNLLFVGDTNRVVCETPSNDASTRSHCIFTIYVESREVGGSRIRRSKLHLVDLAGSERVKKTQIQGKILTEALHINLALHYLEQVIVALHKRTKDRNVHIPYRNSMMTSVLRDSLGGNCKTTLIATMSGQRGHIDESISTCRFAARVAMVRNAAFVNEEIDPKLVIKRLKLQVRELREELAAFQGKAGTEKELDEDEQQRCRQLVAAYLGSDAPTVEQGISNRRKLEYCFGVFKEMLLAAQQGRSVTDGDIVPTKGGGLTSPTSGKLLATGGGGGGGSGNAATDDEVKKLRLMVSSRDNEIAILVSMLKSHVRSGREIELLEDVRARAEKQAIKETGISGVNISSVSNPIRDSLLLSKGVAQLSTIHSNTSADVLGATAQEDAAVLEQRMAAFEEFRRSYRKNQLIEEQKDALKAKIDTAQRLGEAINACRNDINKTKGDIEARRVARGVARLSEGGDATSADLEPDAEELRPKSAIDASKSSYRAHFQSLKDLKSEIEQLKHLIDRSRRKLQADFDAWWTQQNTAVAKDGTREAKQAQLRAAATAAAATPAVDALGATGAFPVHHAAASSPSASPPASSPSSSPYGSAGPMRSYPSSSLIAGSAAVASANQSRPMPPSGSSAPPPAQRLPSTGNARADADIQAFYAMRDSLMKQQQAAQQR